MGEEGALSCMRSSSGGIEGIACSRRRRGSKLRTKALGPSGLPSAELVAAVGAARTQAELFAALPAREEAMETSVDVSIEVYSAGHWHEWDRTTSIEVAQICARRLAASWGRERVRIVPLARLTSRLTRISGQKPGIAAQAEEEADSRRPSPGQDSLTKPQEQNPLPPLLPSPPSPGQPARVNLHLCSARAGAPSPLPFRRYVAVADRWGGSSSPVEATDLADAHRLARELATVRCEPWRVYCLAQTDQGVTWSPDGYPYSTGVK